MGRVFVKKINLIYEENEISELREVIEDIIKSKNKLDNKSVNKMHTELKKINVTNGEGPHTEISFKKDQILYEDSFTNNKILLSNEIRKIISGFNDLILRLIPLSNSFKRKGELYTLFKKRFGNKEVQLVEFYEFVKKNKKEVKSIDEHYKYNDLLANKSLYNQLLSDAITTLKKERDIVNINSKDLPEINKIFGNDWRDLAKQTSYGVLGQFYYNNEKLSMVVNGIYSGFGKNFGRFLWSNKKLVASLKSFLNTFKEKESLLIENIDASLFNANSHPPYLDYQITSTGFQQLYNTENLINLNQINVTLDGEGNLQLTQNNTGKVIIPINIGLEGEKYRSEFYKFLGHFNCQKNIEIGDILNQINKKYASSLEECVLYPRIVYNGNITLQRKAWVYNKDFLPDPDNNEDWEFFYKINIWREKRDLPNEVFVKLLTADDSNELTNQTIKLIGEDSYKPQYISFSQPVSLRLLSTLIRKAPTSIVFQEMLPKKTDMVDISGHKFVTEYGFEWYNK